MKTLKDFKERMRKDAEWEVEYHSRKLKEAKLKLNLFTDEKMD